MEEAIAVVKRISFGTWQAMKIHRVGRSPHADALEVMLMMRTNDIRTGALTEIFQAAGLDAIAVAAFTERQIVRWVRAEALGFLEHELAEQFCLDGEPIDHPHIAVGQRVRLADQRVGQIASINGERITVQLRTATEDFDAKEVTPI